MIKVNNIIKLKHYRRTLRVNQTNAEKLLWKYLRMKRLSGYRSLRQYSVNNYILDFYCPKTKLAIELDGSQHLEREVVEYDRVRTIHLESYNIRVIRFQNYEVKNRISDVLATIFYYLEKV